MSKSGNKMLNKKIEYSERKTINENISYNVLKWMIFNCSVVLPEYLNGFSIGHAISMNFISFVCHHDFFQGFVQHQN